jgi:hypothetical protein
MRQLDDFGVVPLLIASGAGAASRYDIGLVIASV